MRVVCSPAKTQQAEIYLRQMPGAAGLSAKNLCEGGLMTNISRARQAFTQLHQSGTFVIPNPWDVGTAKYLRHLGFKALASTSAGFAFSHGLPDSAVARDAVL